MPTPKQTALILAVITGCFASLSAQADGTLADDTTATLVKRGAYLVNFSGCADCHTPSRMGPNGPEKDMALGLSGHPQALRMPSPPPLNGDWNWAGSASMTAFSGPWGQTYASNLTPDRETGIGNWSAQNFIAAMKNGKHMGVGRPILPPMPWQGLSHLSEKDLRAIYDYLMAQPPVMNRVPEYAPPASATGKPL